MATGFLYGLEGCGEATRRLRRFWSILGDVACELGVLAQGVKVLGVIGIVLRFGWRVLCEPVASQCRELYGREGKLLVGLERLEQRFELDGCVGLVPVKFFEEFRGRFVALIVKLDTQFGGVAFERCGGAFRCDATDQIELNVEIANFTRNSPQLFENATGLAGELVVVGDLGQKRQHCKLAFDAPRRGTQTVHGPRFGIGETERNCGLECCDVLSKRADRACCTGSCHESWMSAWKACGVWLEIVLAVVTMVGLTRTEEAIALL